jgi:hypothetical protein
MRAFEVRQAAKAAVNLLRVRLEAWSESIGFNASGKAKGINQKAAEKLSLKLSTGNTKLATSSYVDHLIKEATDPKNLVNLP